MRTRTPCSLLAGLLLAGCAALADQPDDGSPLAGDTARRCANDDPTSRAEIAAMAEGFNAIGDCLSDDGECQASDVCERGPEARECDASRLIGPVAARCIARVSGLPTGLGQEASLGYHFGERRIVWTVRVTLSDRGGGASSGEGMTIDAVTGEVLDRHAWSATP